MRKQCLFIVFVYSFIFTILTTNKCKIGRFGSECQLQCMCQNRTADCKGVCTQCSFGYSNPPMCQKENIALNKTVIGSGNVSDCGNAVDGDPISSAGLCMQSYHPITEGWLIIDLGFHYDIWSLKLFFSRGIHNGNISVFTAQKPLSPVTSQHLVGQSEECWTSNATSGPQLTPTGIEWNIECKIPRKSRYLIIFKDTLLANITEIEVYYCTLYTYGKDCTEQCNCYYRSEICHKVTGFCPRGCAAGFWGKGCKQKCSKTTYGVDCKHQCNCRNGASCNPIEGWCPGGACNIRYLPDKNRCQLSCPFGFFGYPKCNGICKCRHNSTCDVINGACHGRQCVSPRFTGSTCNQTCPDNFYLQFKGCTGNCHCADNRFCDVRDGNCAQSQCKDGWSGHNCQQNCSSNRWGLNCLLQCYCSKQISCDKTNGSCPKECHHRYSGQSCNRTCNDGWYLVNGRCSGICHCVDTQSCNVADGSCGLSRCVDGYSGPSCQTTCALGYYGLNCKNRCRCKDSKPCNVTTGLCQFGCAMHWTGQRCDKCQKGWFGKDCSKQCHCSLKSEVCDQLGKCQSGCAIRYDGPSCQTTCPVGKYLIAGNCIGTCKCAKMADCQVVDGVCLSGKCKSNRKGSKCEECIVGYYGNNCEYICHCIDDMTCNTKTGYCKSGCKKGWTGNSCHIKYKTEQHFPWKIKIILIVAGVVAILIVLSTIICALCLVKKSKKRKMMSYEKKSSKYGVSQPPSQNRSDVSHSPCPSLNKKENVHFGDQRTSSFETLHSENSYRSDVQTGSLDGAAETDPNRLNSRGKKKALAGVPEIPLPAIHRKQVGPRRNDMMFGHMDLNDDLRYLFGDPRFTARPQDIDNSLRVKQQSNVYKTKEKRDVPKYISKK